MRGQLRPRSRPWPGPLARSAIVAPIVAPAALVGTARAARTADPPRVRMPARRRQSSKSGATLSSSPSVNSAVGVGSSPSGPISAASRSAARSSSMLPRRSATGRLRHAADAPGERRDGSYSSTGRSTSTGSSGSGRLDGSGRAAGCRLRPSREEQQFLVAVAGIAQRRCHFRVFPVVRRSAESMYRRRSGSASSLGSAGGGASVASRGVVSPARLGSGFCAASAAGRADGDAGSVPPRFASPAGPSRQGHCPSATRR